MPLGKGTCGEASSGNKPGRWSTDDRQSAPGYEQDLGVSALFEEEEEEELDTSASSDLSEGSV